MCGISGIISFERTDFNLQKYILEMNKRIRHRGPDDEGFVLFEGEKSLPAGTSDTQQSVWGTALPYKPINQLEEFFSHKPQAILGHRRLSIIDLSPSGHQPMCDSNGRFWIVFNGAIYNFRELKTELLQQGFKFYSNTDTEVLLHAYIAWGEECVNRFIGMWAFAIYDSLTHTIFASRDRVGVKPFYYVCNNHFFAFASEIKALTLLPHVNKELNERAAYDYLFLGKSEQEEETLFRNVFELPPACTLTVIPGEKKVKKNYYYTSTFFDGLEKFEEEKCQTYAGQLKTLLQDSVSLHMRTDAKIGACLSGGLDSSIITALMAENTNHLPVFTAVSEGNSEDESQWASRMVDSFQFDWYRSNSSSTGLLNNFEEFLYAQDLPCTGANSYSHYELMRLVNSQGVKVTIDGQGADELFAGYSPYYGVFLLESFSNGDIYSVIKSLSAPGSDFAQKNELNNLCFIGLSKLFGKNLTFYAYQKKHRESFFIKKEFLESYSDRISILQGKTASRLNRTLYKDFHGNVLKSMMRMGDRNSMRFGVESRPLFCDDHRLEAFALHIPSVYKVRNQYGKYILREAARSFLPYDICYRKDKKGFSVPERKWLLELGEGILPYFDNPLLQPYLNIDKIKENWQNSLKQGKNSRWFWRILSFAVWMKNKDRF